MTDLEKMEREEEREIFKEIAGEAFEKAWLAYQIKSTSKIIEIFEKEKEIKDGGKRA